METDRTRGRRAGKEADHAPRDHTSMETGRGPRCAHAPKDALASARAALTPRRTRWQAPKGRAHAHQTVDALAGTGSCAHATQNRGRTGKLNSSLWFPPRPYEQNENVNKWSMVAKTPVACGCH